MAQEELIVETQKNSDKLNILAVLTEENSFLEKVLINQEKNYEKWLKPPNLNLDRDIEKLLVIDREQKEQIKVRGLHKYIFIHFILKTELNWNQGWK